MFHENYVLIRRCSYKRRNVQQEQEDGDPRVGGGEVYVCMLAARLEILEKSHDTTTTREK